MENAWQAKCAPTLASSSSSVASSVQVPSQISKNQIEANMGYCIQLHDVRQSRFQASAMTRVSSFSSTPDLRPCTGHLDVGNASLLSVPPSQLRSDFQHSSNIRVLSSSYPANFSSAAVTSSSISIPNQRLTHVSRDYNHGLGVDACPLLPSRVSASTGRTGVSFSHGDQGTTVRPSVTHAGSVHIDSRNMYFTQEAYMGSSNASSSRMTHGSHLCTPKKSPPGLPSFRHDQPSPVMGSSRVFCMNKSGDLLLSSKGLLSVVCSCHGLHMSISNFCEHSGFSNVIPGYAVRMDTGETLVQWRKVYFSKRGIRVPEDHKGWEWPEELFSAVGIPRCSAPSVGGIKCSGFSDMACTSVEAEYPTCSYNNFFAGSPHFSQKQIAGVSQIDQPGNSYYEHNIFFAGLSVSPKSNLHPTVSDCVKACQSPKGHTSMKSPCQGGLCNGGLLSSDSCNMVSQTGNCFSQSLGGLIGKAQTNQNIAAVPERGATSSGIELKLGQPSEKCRSLKSTFPATPSHINYPMKIMSQQVLTPGETDCRRHAQLDAGLSSSIRKDKQSDFLKHSSVASSTNMVGNIETLNNDLSRYSRISVPPTYVATPSGGMSFVETTEPPNDRHFIPWTHHFLHHAVKSGQISNADETTSLSNVDGTFSPSNGIVRPSDKSACVSSGNKNLGTGQSNSSLASSETSFCLYARQMERMGFLNRDTHGKYQHSPVNGKNQLSSMLPNILNTSKPPEECGDRNCKGSAHVNFIAPRKMGPSMGFGSAFPSNELFLAMLPATANPAENLEYAVPNKKEVCFGPSKLGESLRDLALVEPAKQDETNSLLRLPKHKKLQTRGPNIQMRGSLLDLLPSEEQRERPNITHKSSMPEFTSRLFSPILSCQVNNNVGISSLTSGANLKNLTGCRDGFTSYYGETSKHCHGCLDPLAIELPFQGAGNEAASQDACKKCSKREYNMRRCNCISYMLSSSKEREFGETSSTRGLKKHSPSSDAFQICASGINMGCVPTNKSILAEKGIEKDVMHEELESSISHLRDVPSKINGDCRLMCTYGPGHGIGGIGESGAAFKDFSAENYPRSSKIDDSFKGKELSDISSGCSGPAVRQVSVEVNKTGSSIVDTEDPINESDQVVDQGSAVDKCLLPNDATLSQTSYEHLSSSAKSKSIGDHVPKFIKNIDCHDRINKHTQCNILRIRDVQSHGLKCVKRKRRTKWTTLGTSFSPSGVALPPCESPSDKGDPIVQQYHLANDDGIMSKSLEESSNLHQVFSRDPSSKRRKTALSLLQRCSRKRHLDRAYDVEIMEDSSEAELKNKSDSLNLPDSVAVKKLKQDNSVKAADKLMLQNVNLNNAGDVLKSNLVGFTERNNGKREDFQGSKMKPIVCGMYGIISSRGNFLRLPKIFSLSQVLKTARKCQVEPQVTCVKESKKRSLDGRFCGFGDGKDSGSSEFRQHSRSLGTSSRGSDEISSVAEYPHPSGWSVAEKQGIDKTKTNTYVSSVGRCAQFKPKSKVVRRRSIYELFVEGDKISSRHTEDSKNTSYTLPKQRIYEMKIRENVGNSDKQLDYSSGDNSGRSMGLKGLPLLPRIDSFCCVCGKSNEDQTNCLLECGRCSIRIHQACYGISRLPKGDWYCRPCSTNSVDTVCVLCGYEGGAMTRASRCDNVVNSLLKAWNTPTESGTRSTLASSEAFDVTVDVEVSRSSTRSMLHNSVTAGLFDPTVKQWIHMVCGLWTPGTRCPNVDTMSSFDVSGVRHSKPNIVCVICKRRGGSSIKCRVPTCSSRFHPWCAHLQGLLQSEPEGVCNEKIGFYGRCMLHAISLPDQVEVDLDSFKINGRKEATCARTEGYKGRKQDGIRYNISYRAKGKGRCIVPQEQVNAWVHINRQKISLKRFLNSSVLNVEHDYKKEYARYKQVKGWKQLMVYKSGIHALGLYTSQLIPRGAMVVEYVGEIVGLRVADKREIEYQSGRKLQYKSACYFFRIDKEHIIDATRKGGIARFVNHSCTPNCIAKIITVQNEKKVVFFAQRDIYPGEEITYDYHFNNEDEGKKIPCFCNSRNCRLYLN